MYSDSLVTCGQNGLLELIGSFLRILVLMRSKYVYVIETYRFYIYFKHFRMWSSLCVAWSELPGSSAAVLVAVSLSDTCAMFSIH
jgi:hypothetical protein